MPERLQPGRKYEDAKRGENNVPHVVRLLPRRRGSARVIQWPPTDRRAQVSLRGPGGALATASGRRLYFHGTMIV
jgi:hypothetical protein